MYNLSVRNIDDGVITKLKQTKEVSDRLAENTYMLNKLLEMIERG